ncbi:hypothetical protein DRE_04445 [Drechslerella stenobrocha 248]|uniref:Uncharacterized protein n=1 Tax=Drechslerella stenobrocha 248 TaxID=1043628 RepID=W7HSP7_9PEZI|nr:hypothetical protein DRE_04445 [Drechslerella stenobrocha 248]
MATAPAHHGEASPGPQVCSSSEDAMHGENIYEIPHTDLLSWVFGGQHDRTKKIFVDAINPGRYLTTDTVKATVRSLIGGLKSIGVKPGDAVCIHSFNDILYPVLFLAIVGAGGVFVGTNPGHTVFELEHHLRISHTKFIITQSSLMKNIGQAAEQVDIPEENILLLDLETKDTSSPRSVRELLCSCEEDWVSFQDEKAAKETMIALFASSGTTGMPKMIGLSHYAWVAGGILLREVLERPYEVNRLMCLPSFHAFASPLTVIIPVRMGQTTYILPRFELGTFCDAAEKYAINETAVAPPCLQAFLKAGSERQAQLRTIKRIWCGGAPLNVKLQLEACQVLSADAEVVNIWGMTEIGITVGMKFDEADRTGAVSKLLANTEARIVDEHGVNVTLSGGYGEVQIRSPQVSMGYFENEKATRECFLADGWVRTGDVAYFRGRKLYILDRKKEMIKVRGWQVAPAELEAVLVSHPAIKDAAVVGVKIGAGDEEHEVPRAYVVCMEGFEISKADVKAFLLSKLSKYKALDGGVIFVKAIPKSAAGKILKKIIRAQWIAGDGEKQGTGV